ncbi:hypothetical protein P256_00972 [Acinetobacter nectaris CIP 110549]|uniref:Uncharacterized protein n=1 Tax=Acinetobacter nectaris CIP 110549 TaxID=1392540 RepID=V2UYY1_9GAMM|nr:NfeD family protein [Acinetobacter nectaris]ESK40519.1 hypothetical protein P256_00972 [Acinetobacter nectaris CIP 110549]
MNIMLEPWHWFVLGIVLILLELFLATFAILWFGIAAIMLSLLYWLSPWMSTATQILTWAIFSILNTILWFKFIKPFTKRRNQNPSNIQDILGQTGTVIQIFPNESHSAKVRFTIPLLGTEEWLSECDQALHVGDRIEVTGIQDKRLLVKLHNAY